jgi:hypothetical protein
MISRTWRGWTTHENAGAYEALLLTSILPGIRARLESGYHGAFLYRREIGNEVEFLTTMLFDSMEIVRHFAGDDYEVAVVPAAARELLVRFDSRSSHYEVLLSPE